VIPTVAEGSLSPAQQFPLLRQALVALAGKTLDAFENRRRIQVRFRDHV
jgi:hypothetical protein